MVTMSQPPISAEALALGLPGRMGRSVQYPTATGLCEECPWHNGHRHAGVHRRRGHRGGAWAALSFRDLVLRLVFSPSAYPGLEEHTAPGPAERDLTTVHRALNPGQARLVPGPQLQERPSKSGRL